MIECTGCIMIANKCLMIDIANDYIEDCPCLKCLVKITCDYDTVCDRYESYIKALSNDERYRERIREYDLRYNTAL